MMIALLDEHHSGHRKATEDEGKEIWKKKYGQRLLRATQDKGRWRQVVCEKMALGKEIWKKKIL